MTESHPWLTQPVQVIGQEAMDALETAGWFVVHPYQKVMVEGEGSTDEYQFVPTSRIETLEEVILILKGERK